MYGVGYPVMYKTTAGGYALWFLIVLAFGKILATSLTMGVGGSGGIFAPSLFIGVTAGYAYGDIVDHLFGAGAGQPALYAVIAMGAVFAAAARAPLTSLASVVEMTGDFSLTLPVMLAVAIATAVSRALSYSTIYTAKLLRRGSDIDRAAPWRALQDLKLTDVMRPFQPALPIPPVLPVLPVLPADTGTPTAIAAAANGGGTAARPAAADGPATGRYDPQALFASDSLAKALRQLEVYGRDGLPVISADGRRVEGWITSGTVLRALARRLGGTGNAAVAQASADRDRCDDTEAMPQDSPAPIAGYQVTELTITADSPAAGRNLHEVTWPQAGIPVSVLRGRRLGPPDPGITLAEGDRVGLLIPAPSGPERPHQDRVRGGKDLPRPHNGGMSAWARIARYAARPARNPCSSSALISCASPASTASIAVRIAIAAVRPRSVNRTSIRRRSTGSLRRSRYSRRTRVSINWLAACLLSPSEATTSAWGLNVGSGVARSKSARTNGPLRGTSSHPAPASARPTAWR